MDLPNTKNLGFLLDGLYTQAMKMVMTWGYLGDMAFGLPHLKHGNPEVMDHLCSFFHSKSEDPILHLLHPPTNRSLLYETQFP
jgi:hypothetical protein